MTVDLADPIAVMLVASGAFRAAGLEALAYGGLVVAMYGRPRETQDADLAIATATVDAAHAALVDAGLNVTLAFADMRFGGCTVSRLTLLGGGELNTVDLVRPRSARFAAQVLVRGVEGTLRGEAIRVVSAEDYVLLKILATRDRDLEDARSVLDHQQGRLDEALLMREAQDLATELPDHDIQGRAKTLGLNLR